MSNTLRWKRVALWHLGQGEQVLFTADGCKVQYNIARSGTADKPWWRLYTRLSDGTEEQVCGSALLRHVKSAAIEAESRIRA